MSEKESGFSGLEAAIVVIAFVVVAAFFAISVLNSGFFAAQESEKQVSGGVKQAGSSVYIEGSVYATLESSGGALDSVRFAMGILETGQPQDLSKMKIVYTHSKDINELREYSYSGGSTYSATEFGADGSSIMRPGEKRVVTLGHVNGPIPGGWFTIEVKPQLGASTFVKYYLADSYNGGVVLQ
ncbi:archaellin/type IV pilin N-terminal domain-containing protein [uncultured Methanospirillum sp.]|uniref:archaellin/type IV pilin N-terminal domain-containing protein n=1 Tax=uncultured Methanospirillum sp. TaxID=262503 RepID=UPI0029C8E99C|nr:archaellin/type IV pilin N-terminal domain-containing protein [uncultured Methanospirillum sp.]